MSVSPGSKLNGGHDMADPRQTRAWRKLRDRVLREEPTCRLRLPGICTGVSTTGGHIKPVETHPHLALVRSNVRGECWPCNRAKGTLPDELLKLDTEQPTALGIFTLKSSD